MKKQSTRPRRLTEKQNNEAIARALAEECNFWLDQHPGRTEKQFSKLLADPKFPANELGRWRLANWEKADRTMRRAWLRENPGERSLPEHLCALDHPYPGFKRYCAKALRWLARYEAKAMK